MKSRFPILALALLFPMSSHAADVAAPTRARYAAVNKNVRTATIVKRELQGYSAEGGELTAYFKNSVPLKMNAKYYGESGRATEEFYFWQGRLFLIVRTSWRYDKTLWAVDDFNRETKFIRDKGQERWYFNNGKLWRWIQSDGKIVESGAELENQQENYLGLTREFLAGARGKTKVIGAQ